VRRYQKTTRHTIHIEATSARIIRPHHPLNGKELKIFGQALRNGVVYLILILPDDSHAYIPIAWTNLQTQSDDDKKGKPISHPIAYCRDLMRAQVVVDSLLRKMSCNQTATKTQKENYNGANDLMESRTDKRIGSQSDLGTTRSCRQNGCDYKVVTIDGKDRKHKRNAK
jgi:hypothetical protein